MVEETLRGFGLGSLILERLVTLAKETGCYKCILDCKEENVAFYQRCVPMNPNLTLTLDGRCGFVKKEVMMARYFEENKIENLKGYAVLQSTQSDGLLTRALRGDDIDHGFLGLLAQLTTVGEVPEKFFIERLQAIEGSMRQHMLVIEDIATAKVVATATLLVERKFIHQAGFAGHIEDVVCDKDSRGKGLGRRIIQAAVELARCCGCYKVCVHVVPNRNPISCYSH